MSTSAMVVSRLLTVVGIAANFAYWWWILTRGEKRWRARVERRYGVTIGTAGRGMWSVVSDHHGWLARMGIELLQLVYFIGAMVLWAGVIIGVLLLAMVSGRFD